MKSSPVRWTLIAATLLSVVVISAVAARSSPLIDGIAFADAKVVKSTLTGADLKTQDSLVAKFTSFNQFAEMDADDQEKLIAVADATWYKDDVVLGYSIDRRGRAGLASDAASPILLEARHGQLVFNCVLWHGPRADP